MLPKIFNGLKTTLDKKKAEKCDRICANMCEVLDMRHNFRICNFANAIICRKICDMWILAKYAIAYSHITKHPNMSGLGRDIFSIVNCSGWMMLLLTIWSRGRRLVGMIQLPPDGQPHLQSLCHRPPYSAAAHCRQKNISVLKLILVT